MSQAFIPEIPILDCEEHSPYYKSIIKNVKRVDAGLYDVEFVDLNKGLLKIKSAAEGDQVIYKIQKVIIDEKCETRFIT